MLFSKILTKTIQKTVKNIKGKKNIRSLIKIHVATCQPLAQLDCAIEKSQ